MAPDVWKLFTFWQTVDSSKANLPGSIMHMFVSAMTFTNNIVAFFMHLCTYRWKMHSDQPVVSACHFVCACVCASVISLHGRCLLLIYLAIFVSHSNSSLWVVVRVSSIWFLKCHVVYADSSGKWMGYIRHCNIDGRCMCASCECESWVVWPCCPATQMTSTVTMMTWVGRCDARRPNVWLRSLLRDMRCSENFTASFHRHSSAGSKVSAVVALRTVA